MKEYRIDTEKEMQDGLKTAFINRNWNSNLAFRPEFVSNDYKRGKVEQDNRIFLFVRKNKDDNEAKEFYFLGEIFAEGNPEPIHMETTKDDAFEIFYRLDVPVRSDIYDYIVSE